MVNLKGKRDWKRLGILLLQGALILFWFLQLSRHELYSREGYRYNKFDGLYLLCGFAALVGAWDGLRMPGRRSRAAVASGVIYGLATVLANYPAFEPFDRAGNVLRFGLAALGGFLVGYQILALALRRLPVKLAEGERTHATAVYLGSFFSLAAIYLLYLFCSAYPGLYTRDSFTAVRQCVTGVYDNTSPFWHTVIVKLCLELGGLLGLDRNGALSLYGIFQSLAMAAVFAYALVTLYQAGIPSWCLVLVYGAYGLSCYNIAFSATLWKDIPFSIGALLMVVALYRLLAGIGKSRRTSLAMLVLGSLTFCLMRTNGLYSLLATAAALALAFGKRERKLLLVFCAVLAAGWICNHPVLDALGVSETDYVEALAIPFQQIGRVVAEDCGLSETDREMVEEIFDTEVIRQVYDPLTVNPMKYEAFRNEQRDFLREHMGEYAGLWLRLGLQYPWQYMKAWIDETQGYWNAGYHYWIWPEKSESPELGIIRPPRDNAAAAAFDALFRIQQSVPVLAQPTLGIGFQVWILLGCMAVNLAKKRREWLLAVPVLVVVVGLWVGTPVFAEFRYAYPVFVTVPVLICLAAFQIEK